jgi:hypothetical protein
MRSKASGMAPDTLGRPRSSRPDMGRPSALREVGRRLCCQPGGRHRRPCSPLAALGNLQLRCCPGEPCLPCAPDNGQEPQWLGGPGHGSGPTQSSREDHVRGLDTMQHRLLWQALRQRLRLRPQSRQVLSLKAKNSTSELLAMSLERGLWINKRTAGVFQITRRKYRLRFDHH